MGKVIYLSESVYVDCPHPCIDQDEKTQLGGVTSWKGKGLSGQAGFEGSIRHPHGDDWPEGGCVSLDCSEVWETPALM